MYIWKIMPTVDYNKYSPTLTHSHTHIHTHTHTHTHNPYLLFIIYLPSILSASSSQQQAGPGICGPAPALWLAQNSSVPTSCLHRLSVSQTVWWPETKLFCFALCPCAVAGFSPRVLKWPPPFGGERALLEGGHSQVPHSATPWIRKIRIIYDFFQLYNFPKCRSYFSTYIHVTKGPLGERPFHHNIYIIR